MESADGQRGRGAGGGGSGQRRSPLDVIMSQIRRKRAAPDRKSPGSFLSHASDRSGISEDGEAEGGEERGRSSAGVCVAAEDVGWGRVRLFLQRLGKKADSRSLSVAHCDLTATDLLELATLLQFLPELEEADVSWNELIGGCLDALTSHLHHVGGVRALRLSGCRLDAADAAALGDALGCVPFLEVLDLSWNGGVGGGGLQGLLGNLQPSLRELLLVSCRLAAADVAALGAALSALPRLRVLDVSCNPRLAQEVGDGEVGGGFADLAASLCHAGSLAKLGLQACGLTASCLDALGAALRHLSSLRELDLSCNKSVGGALDRLTPHLAHLTHLESLDLHLCRLTHADLRALIQVIPALTALTELDVSSNKEAGAVVEPLVSALPLSQVKRLPLGGCGLTEESFTALVLAVPYLRSVDVSWCKAAGGRLVLLLDALRPSVVTELRLSSCGLRTDDLRHLAVACGRGRLSSLRALDLSYNGSVGDDGWAALFAAGGLGSLEDLDLSLRPSTSAPCSAWLPALLRALPGLPALTRLAARRWAIGPRDRRQLNRCLRKRDVLLEWDLDAGDAAASSREPTNRESPEE